jgi:hypothetical protein
MQRSTFVRERITRQALETGRVSPELAPGRAEHVPTFTHFLDLPILLVIIMLGALRPTTWIALAVGLGVAVRWPPC